MPLLILAALGIPLALTSGALAVNSVTDDVNRTAPNIALIAALALAGYMLWMTARKR
jgi:hypothetical protein